MKKWLSLRDGLDALRGRRMERAKRNLAANREAFKGLEGKLLNGQGTDKLKKLTYSKHSLELCGCEIIAVDNTLLLTGRDIPLPDVICEFEMNKMQILFSSGCFGSKPRKIKNFYDHYNIGCKTFYDVASLESELSKREKACGILSFWIKERKGRGLKNLLFFTKGFHTVAFVQKHGKVYVYNRYNSSESATQYYSVSDVIGTRPFIMSYLLDDEPKG